MTRAQRAGAAVPPAVTLRALLFTIGPALVVMLADTEVGSVVTAAQSGATWGYRLVLPQLLLLPGLFMAQELAGRLGLLTGQGLAELVLRHNGRQAAWLLLATLAASCIGALVTQLSGVAGVGEMVGVPPWQSGCAAAVFLLAVIWTGTYRSVEGVAIAVGLCELAFIALAILARPSGAELRAQLLQAPLADRSYLYLLAANLGTCIIPWAVFYQQSASIDKGLSRRNLSAMRLETLGGALLCQTVTAAVVVAAAASIGQGGGQGLARIGDIAHAFSTRIGAHAGRALFSIGLCGGALVAAIVVCLTAAWALGELLGRRHSLGDSPAQAPWFYGALTVVMAGGAALVGAGIDLVRLSIAAGVLNSLLLPVVLWFLWRLARHALPADARLRGAYAALVGMVLTLTSGLGLVAAILGLVGA